MGKRGNKLSLDEFQKNEQEKKQKFEEEKLLKKQEQEFKKKQIQQQKSKQQKEKNEKNKSLTSDSKKVEDKEEIKKEIKNEENSSLFKKKNKKKNKKDNEESEEEKFKILIKPSSENEKIINEMKKVFGENFVENIDKSILNYLGNIILGENSLTTRIGDEELFKIIFSFLIELDIEDFLFEKKPQIKKEKQDEDEIEEDIEEDIDIDNVLNNDIELSEEEKSDNELSENNENNEDIVEKDQEVVKDVIEEEVTEKKEIENEKEEIEKNEKKIEEVKEEVNQTNEIEIKKENFFEIDKNEEIKNKLNNFFNNLKQEKILIEFDEKSLKKESVKVLEEAVNLGKQFQEQINQQQKIINSLLSTGEDDSGLSETVNYNSTLNWKQKKVDEANSRELKKIEKEKLKKLQEYQDYLKKRGISQTAATKGIVKLHKKEEIIGTRDIIINNISLVVGNKELLQNATMRLVQGRKYGLIGRNGVGKTTLLRNIVDGEVQGIPLYLQIVHVEQEVTGDDISVIDTILQTDVEREALLNEEKVLLEGKKNDSNLKEEEISEKLNDIYTRMDEIDAHSAESRAITILSGLGFTSEMLKEKTKNFSGGWRMRISIAKALFVEPDILFLDEPTNHLDLHATLWLERFLKKNWKKTLVVVSHQRNFLNVVVEEIIHFHSQKLLYYKGTYDDFEKRRREELLTQQKSHEAQELRKKHIESFINRFKYKTKTAAMAQSRIKVLKKMKENFIPAAVEDSTFQFSIPVPDQAAPPFIQAVDVGFYYKKDKWLFKHVDFNVDNETRIALVGPNGCGKTTFLKVVTGILQPKSGNVNINKKMRVGFFSQHHNDQLNMQSNPLEYLQSKYPLEKNTQAFRSALSKVGLESEHHEQPIYTLSGGQKSRVSFATIFFNKPHVLILDEPTNHLDMDTIDALIDALNEFEGGVVLISHNDHLITSVCDEIYVVSNSMITRLNCDFAGYVKSLKFDV